MLNQEICRKCRTIAENVLFKSGYDFDKRYKGHVGDNDEHRAIYNKLWTEFYDNNFFEKVWNEKNLCLCPYSERYQGMRSLTTYNHKTYPITLKPPQQCPYTLEQMLIKNDQ